MHLSDALLSVPVAAAGIACSAAALVTAAGRAERTDGREAMDMGIWGAFVFAAQMLNIAIPGTGASGHLIGALLLSCLFGPWRALITMSAVLIIQALMFADGGLLALGWNIFNMGVIPCLLVFPFLVRPFGRRASGWSMVVVTGGAVLAIELAAFAAVIQIHLSQMLHLPFGHFLGLMMGIHLPIGILEGLVTAWALALIHSFSPARIPDMQGRQFSRSVSMVVLCCAAVLSGWISWYASTHPDGLEWSLETAAVSDVKVDAGRKEADGQALNGEEDWVLFPDYALRSEEHKETDGPSSGFLLSSVPGLAGSGAVLLGALLAGAFIGRRSRVKQRGEGHG